MAFRIFNFCFIFLIISAPNLQAQFVPMHRESMVPLQLNRKRINFNRDWTFKLGDSPEAKQVSYKGEGWRKLNLPHDWSIEGDFDEKNPSKPEGGGLPTGIAWYRKEFTAPKGFEQLQTLIEFDGVYKNSEIWLNGKLVGNRPYGYSSFTFDISGFLKNGTNYLAVKVDNSAQPDSRWYSGSGIYRNVWLTTKSKLAVSHWGTKVIAKLHQAGNAEVEVNAEIGNLNIAPQNAILVHKIYSKQGNLIGSTTTEIKIPSKGKNTLKTKLKVAKPELWSVDKPNLYLLVTEILQNGKIIDRETTRFGIRSIHFDAEKGFFLNHKSLKIQGVCLHHDLGALGAAVNKRAMQRQLEILKEMGCNAIRTAHNPPAPEFLDLCDEMGFLVMDEAFDVWKKKKVSKDYNVYFNDWHRRDLEDMIKRDINHPSIIMWSIGNEIREQFDSTGIALTKELVSIVKSIDQSRPVTAALTETDAKKNFIYQAGVLDIYGLNYNHKQYKDFPKNYPGQKFIGSETTSALATRGFYDLTDSIRRWPKDGKTKFIEGNPYWTASAYDNVSAYWGSTHEETLKEAKKYPHVSGIFVWTGFDYLGEPLPYPWPARSSYFGIVDLAGFPKDSYYLYQSEWTSKPVLHLLPHWNWPVNGLFTGKKSDSISVWAYYSQADEVELFLNDKSLGKRFKKGDEMHVEWLVSYKPGVLKAVSRKGGKTVLVKEIHTAGPPARIELIADRSQIKPDGVDLSFVTVKITDKDGNIVPEAENLVNFEIDGPGFLAGVDNGFQASLESFKANHRKAYKGLCLAIVQAKEKKGKVTLKASSEGLASSSITIKIN